MSKKKVQTNGNDKRDAATEVASGTTAVVDAGKANSVADDTAPHDNAPGTSVAAVIDDAGNGSVIDGGREELSQVGSGEGPAEGIEKTADTGGETRNEVSADTSGGNGRGVDAAEHKSGNLQEHGSANEPLAAAPAGNDEPGASGAASHEDFAATDGDIGGGNPASGNDGGQGTEVVERTPRSRFERRGGRLYARCDGETSPDLNAKEEPHSCFICNEVFKADDLCATDIEEGTCHAACLEGSPVVDLTTGEPSDGPVTTFRYVEASKEVDETGTASDDLKAALELAGCETAEQLIDMALVGSSLMERTTNIIKLDGEFKDWSPMDDPAELVDDLFQALEHAKEKAGNTEQPNVPNWAPDADPREIAHSFAYDVFRGVHGSVDIARVVINGGTPVEAPAVSFEAVSDLVELVRKIGSRATPEVLAQQLVIGKHRQSAALTKAEEIALKAFASVLIDLDEYAASERARIEAEAAEKPKPRAVPIDETNGELTDGPMDTWR